MSKPPEILPDGTMVVQQPVELPEVLDVLIVGAGPAGTGAAFRAKELGLSALVIEMDDVLAKIRDYPKEKDILPDYGKGDRMGFPDTGLLLRELHFAPIDPVTMQSRWKALYSEHSVPVKLGVELTGLERTEAGVWRALARNRNLRQDERFTARAIVLALGRGVPRRFDIPGNLDDVAFRLSDPGAYVGSPMCVIGGGTSAAEAVIAISNAKIRAEDPTAVYWSYRGDRMPRVNDALSEAFFEAYLKNGNIRYCPMSDPVAVVTAEDKNEYLAIRVDRKFIEGRPNETAHLEFPKHRVVACIGEEFPEKFLRGLGIPLAMGGRPKKMRALVSAELETGQPRVFVVGDTLSDYHLMTSDFRAEASRFELVERTGNIKAGLLDGVRAIEVIRQRLSGAVGEAVVVPVTPARAVLPAVPGEDGPAPATPEPEMTVRQMSGREPNAIVPERVVAHLVSLLVDGTKGESYPVVAGRVTTLGKTEGDITFPQDTWLDARHASLVHAPDGFLLRDDGSGTGVFLRMPPGKTMPLPPGSYVRAGKRFLHFVADADPAFVEVFDRDGKQVARHELTPRLTTFGRGLADIELDAEDRTLSKRHLSAQWVDQQLLVADLGSRNGSYLRIPGSWKLETGDEIRLGQQRLRLEVVDEQVVQPGQGVAGEGTLTFLPRAPRLEPEPLRESVAAVPATAGGASSECDIVFANLGRTVRVEPEYSVLEAAEENEIEIPCDCRGGTCGADPIRILSGMENFNEPEALEREWLAKFGFDGLCRFACMARVHGNVKVEILSPKKKS